VLLALKHRRASIEDEPAAWRALTEACAARRGVHTIDTYGAHRLADNDDARLVEMYREANAASATGNPDAWVAWFKATGARKAIGDHSVFERIRRLADAK
jgi:hypothetical protein